MLLVGVVHANWAFYAQGDSLTAGYGVADQQNMEPDLAALFSNMYPVINDGIGSTICMQDYANMTATNIPDGSQNVIMLECGINDIHIATVAGAENWTYAFELYAMAHNNSLIVNTVTATDDGVSCPDTLALNAWIESNVTANGFLVNDFYHQMYNGTDCFVNSTLYQNGALHPNEAGDAVWAANLYSLINDQLIDPSSSSTTTTTLTGTTTTTLFCANSQFPNINCNPLSNNIVVFLSGSVQVVAASVSSAIGNQSPDILALGVALALVGAAITFAAG